MSTFKQFKLDTLFNFQTGDVNLQQKDVNGKGCYFINSGVTNQGIKGKTDRPARIFPAGTITIDFFGNAYYRDYEYKLATHNHVFSLSGDVIRNEAVGLYLVTCLQKLSALFSYNNMATVRKLKQLSIQLPITSNESIDYGYMEERIAELEQERVTELEQERVTELEQYLTAAGLSDYTLTNEDKETLFFSQNTMYYEDIHNTNTAFHGLTIREFKIGDLFTIHPTKAHSYSNSTLYSIRGETPVVSNKSSNNGIGGMCGREATEKGGIITFSDTTIGAETMFYQPNNFIGYPHVQGMYPINDAENKITEKVSLYLIGSMRRAFSGGGYSYANKFTREIVARTNIKLPATEQGAPDWDYMERYITAIQKIVIADIVQYKDSVITTTKQMVAAVVQPVQSSDEQS